MTAQAPYESLTTVDEVTDAHDDGRVVECLPPGRTDWLRTFAYGNTVAADLAAGWQYRAALPEREPVSAGGDAVLPCDVLVAPATIVGKGCKVSTLMSVIEGRRENPPELTDEQRANLRKLLNVATPAPPVGADWVMVDDVTRALEEPTP